jgi:hypothetical protein
VTVDPGAVPRKVHWTGHKRASSSRRERILGGTLMFYNLSAHRGLGHVSRSHGSAQRIGILSHSTGTALAATVRRPTFRVPSCQRGAA